MALGARMENGWPECDLSDCDYATIPGTALRLPFRRGIPFTILQAFLRDLNQYVESANNSRGYSDEGSWTEDNSVYTSNHKGATAFDYNWDDHPMGVALDGWHGSDIVPGEQEPAVRELLSFYTFEGLQLVWWGNDWNSPKDSMHFQMGYDTAQNQDKCQRFIQKCIRPDGFSTFRRGGSGGDVPLSKKDGYALATINEGKRLNITPKGICIALAVELVETNLTMYANKNVPESLNHPHDAVGSDHDSTGLFQQRQAWGPLSMTMDPTLSARLFFNGGLAGQRGLTDFDYNSDARTPGGWAQAVQVSAFPDRYDERFAEAEQIYTRLSNLVVEDDFLSALTPDEQKEALSLLRVLAKTRFDHRSMYAEGPDTDTTAGRALSGHAFGWDDRVESSAYRGEPWAIELVAQAAAGVLHGVVKQDGTPDQFRVDHARAVINDLEKNYPSVLQNYLALKGARR